MTFPHCWRIYVYCVSSLCCSDSVAMDEPNIIDALIEIRNSYGKARIACIENTKAIIGILSLIYLISYLLSLLVAISVKCGKVVLGTVCLLHSTGLRMWHSVVFISQLWIKVFWILIVLLETRGSSFLNILILGYARKHVQVICFIKDRVVS